MMYEFFQQALDLGNVSLEEREYKPLTAGRSLRVGGKPQ